jgi:hypothetical protein
VTGDHLTIDVLRYPHPLLVRAILMALGSSVLSSDLSLAKLVLRYCWWPATAPLFGSQPRRPSCICSGLRTPLPNLPVRAPAVRRLYRGTTRNRTAGTAVLLMAAPDHCGPPSPAVSPVAVLRQPWLRNSTAAPSAYCCPAVHLCQALLDLDYERNHNHPIAQCLLQPIQIFVGLTAR